MVVRRARRGGRPPEPEGAGPERAADTGTPSPCPSPMTFGSPACCSSTAGWTTCASFTTDDVRLLETIANHARMSLDRSDLVERLRQDRCRADAPGHPRPPHRPAEPAALAAAVRDALGEQRWRQGRRRPDGPRRLQGDERHAGPPHGRRGAARRSVSASRTPSRPAIRWPGWAATSSPSSVRRCRPSGRRGRGSPMPHPCSQPRWPSAGSSVDVGGSAGVAIAPEDGLDANALLAAGRRGDVRRQGEGRTGVASLRRGAGPVQPPIAWPSWASSAARSSNRSSSLTTNRRSTLASGRITGVEALVRCPSPDAEAVVSPDDFIPLAEQHRADPPADRVTCSRKPSARSPGGTRRAVI